MLEDYRDVLTVNDLYNILPIGKNKIYELINTGTLKSVKIGTKNIIPKKYLLEFLDNA